MSRTLFLTLILFSLFNSDIFARTGVVSTFKYQQQNSPLIAYSGKVTLPYQGFWKIADSKIQSQVQEVYLRRDSKRIREKHPEYLQSKLSPQQEKEQ